MEQIIVTATDKKELYEQILPQIDSLTADEPNAIANMANVTAALKQTFGYYSWIGFYLYDKERNELVLGPFQGKIACTRIAPSKGVCGASFTQQHTLIVPDVNQFPGHIFCDGDSKSEIVLPLIHHGSVFGVLDVDSHTYNSFDTTDQEYLERMLNQIIERIIV